MDLPSPVSHYAYDKLSQKIHQAVKYVAVEVMEESAEEVHMLAAVASDVDKSDTDAVNAPVDMDFADIGTDTEIRDTSSEVSDADDGIVNTSVLVDAGFSHSME